MTEIETSALQRIHLIEEAMDAILGNDETKRDYLQLVANVSKLYKAILPDPDADAFTGIYTLTNIIAQKIRNLTTPADISEVMTGVKNLLDQSIAPEDYFIEQAQSDYDTENQGHRARVDLSRIDFDMLREKFRTGHKRIEIERLRRDINAKLTAMIQLNKNRMDYQTDDQRIMKRLLMWICSLRDSLNLRVKSIEEERARTEAKKN